MSFEKLSLTAFTEAVMTTLKNNNVDAEIQKNIIDNISVFLIMQILIKKLLEEMKI